MARVRGSRQVPLVVVPHRPWLRPLLLAASVIVLALVAGATFWLGWTLGFGAKSDAVIERDRLRVQLQRAEQELTRLRPQVANLKLGAEVDRRASEEVRAQVLTLKQEVAALEEDISFYRNLMAPSENRKGLTIGSLSLIDSGRPREYDYKLVLQQLARSHSLLNGSLRFTLVGRREQERESLPLMAVSDSVDSVDIKLRFKYFQTIEGTLTLPPGFEPEGIELEASSRGKNPMQVTKNFGWLVEER